MKLQPRNRAIFLATSFATFLLFIVFHQNIFAPALAVRNYEGFAEKQSDFTIHVATATARTDGVHFEGGMPEMLVWGPKQYSIEEDGTVWIDDTPASRRIQIDANGQVVATERYSSGMEPVEEFEQNLSDEQLKVQEMLTRNSQYDGFNEESPEVYYWGTSPVGYQYWQVTEMRQDDNGVLRVKAFIFVVGAAGKVIAVSEIPVASQYTYVFHGGVFVNPDRDAAYFMTTSPRGVTIQSVDWRRP